MTFEIECGGVVRRVEVEPAGDSRYRVTLEERTMVVSAVRGADGTVSLLEEGSGRSREVALTPTGSGTMLAWIEGLTLPVAIDGRRPRRGGAVAGGGGSGEQVIAAPMPGRVVRVLVGAGDAVAARQPCVVVEAMKMENELRAPRAGRVKSVAVEAGTPVEAGRALVVIE